ncbi:MAG: hypothetical protein ACTHMM_19880 [Agriterribacter sp.]
MLNNDFCERLERKISEAFTNSGNEKAKHFWCDGVLLPTFENEYSRKFVNDNRQIVMAAFIGLSGQDKYELVLKFGDKALSKYARGLDIFECIPNSTNETWFDIDVARRKILIQLD